VLDLTFCENKVKAKTTKISNGPNSKSLSCDEFRGKNLKKRLGEK